VNDVEAPAASDVSRRTTAVVMSPEAPPGSAGELQTVDGTSPPKPPACARALASWLPTPNVTAGIVPPVDTTSAFVLPGGCRTTSFSVAKSAPMLHQP
jgi:hypothetical protein